jgi:hypothetical protein
MKMTGAVSLLASVATLALASISMAQEAPPSPPPISSAQPAPSPEPPAPAPPPPPPAAGGKIERAVSADDCLATPANSRQRQNQVRDDALILSNCAQSFILAGQDAPALEALARSDTIGAARNDPIFDGSVGIRNAMMRAFVLNRLGRRDEAVAEVGRVRDRRRYSVLVQWGLDRLLASFDGTLAQFIALGNARVPDHPDMLRSLFLINLARGDMPGALPYAETMTLENPRPIGGWTVDGAGASRELSEHTELNAMRAYVFTANGRSDRSRAMLAEIDRDIAEFVGARPVAAEGRRVSRSVMDAYEVRAGLGRQMEQSIDNWKQAIAARARLNTGNVLTREQLERDFPGAAATGAILDLALRVSISDPGAQRQRGEAVQRIERDMLERLVNVSARDLVALMPEVETLDRYPRFGRAGDGILIGRDRGYSQAQEEGTTIRTVRFGTVTGSNATADELSLLAAATYAARDNFDSFILLSRRNLDRQMRIVGGYGGGSVLDHGSEGQIRVIMLNSASLPPEWATQRHRLIMAQDVLSSLGSRQEAIEARREAAARNRRR